MSDDRPSKPKRSRLALSCIRCRSRKIRCDLKEPQCDPCVHAGANCVRTKPGCPSSSSSRLNTTNDPLDISSEVRPEVNTENQDQQNYYPAGEVLLALSGGSAANDGSPLTIVVPSTSRTGSGGPDVAPQPELSPRSRSPPRHEPSFHPSSTDPGRVQNEYFIHGQDHRRKFLGASSSQVFIKWLDQESSGAKVSQHLTHGMGFSEELLFPAMGEPHHLLPSETDLTTYVDAYFRNYHIMYPILDEETIRAHFNRSWDLHNIDDCLLPVLYLVVSLGADLVSQSRQTTQVGKTYFEYAWKALPVLMARPFRTSAQALVLLALTLRARHKDGMVWTIIGTAIRICQSLGLQRQSFGPQASLDARIWFTAISLDALGSFDSGRPSCFQPDEYSVTLSAFDDTTFTIDPSRPPINVLRSLAELCQEISHISARLFSTNATSLSAVDVLEQIGKCHESLQLWLKRTPIELRPGTECPMPGPAFPYAALLHSIYHQIVITLNRLSLFDTNRLILPNLSHPRLQPFADVLASGESTCTQSARAILIMIDASKRTFQYCNYWTLNSVTTAIFALYIHTWKNASTWQAQSDLQLLANAGTYAARLFLELGMHPNFVIVFDALHRKVERKILNPHEASRGPTRATSPASGVVDNVTLEMHNEPELCPADMADLWSFLIGPGPAMEPEINETFDDLFGLPIL